MSFKYRDNKDLAKQKYKEHIAFSTTAVANLALRAHPEDLSKEEDLAFSIMAKITR